MSNFETSSHGIDRASLGLSGFKRIVGPASVEGEFVAVKAMNGDVVFDADCQVFTGDAPADNDLLAQGDVLPGTFTKVDVKTGTAYCYIL